MFEGFTRTDIETSGARIHLRHAVRSAAERRIKRGPVKAFSVQLVSRQDRHQRDQQRHFAVASGFVRSTQIATRSSGLTPSPCR